MSRSGLLLLLLLAVPAKAEPPIAPPKFNAALATDIYTAALGFIAPRALTPVTVPQLAVWGLKGLTALDPDLMARENAGQLELATGQRMLYIGAAPPEPNPRAWATVAVSMTGVGWRESAALRRAGTQKIEQSFFNEMLNHLDPYSRYIRPDLAAQEQALRGGTAGIGTALTRRHGAILVQSISPNSPAAGAGMRSGDRILSVDGRSVTGQEAATIAGWIAGPEASPVRMVWRGADGRTRDVEILRAIIARRTVFPDWVAHLLVLRVTAFVRNTSEDFAESIARALDSRHPPQGVVIDLRGNRGGLLAEAVTVADELLPGGVVAIEEGRDPAANRIWYSASGELAKEVPIVVLVDGRTASAAEVLAAALADRGRAVVVGSSTLGKGLVQTFTTLPDGGELFVTWSRMLAPRGWPIQGLGVLPQVCTSRGEDELERQLQSLAAGVQPMAASIDRARAARASVSPAEIVTIRGACPAAEGRDGDLDAADDLIADPAAYAAALLPPMRGPARQ